MSDNGTTTSRDLAVAAARAAAGKLGERIVILDVRDLIVITDYFVIASGASDRQVRAIAEDVEKALRDLGARSVRREGELETHWMLLDFVDIVVHVFAEEERDFYDLERLWADAPREPWAEPSQASG